ncbi:hypothetical protein GYMLUDRAFT_69898 [Collybiopsis luxurians FD-317 M1]|nr:hypothetical protein GYMLUDRAFT_69898 [Collybiopsis luxurians FD-317 M1]
MPTSIQHLDDYLADGGNPGPLPPPTDHKPWLPFQTQMNFEIATLTLECSMNQHQTNTLLEIISCAQQGFDQCTMRNYDEVQRMWDLAADKSTQDKILVPYWETAETFDVFYQPMWDWVHELLMDPRMVSRMQWHACHLFRYDKASGRWMQFINEPCTANKWWNIQGSLPSGGVPLCIIFYADKSKLSSFGTAKGYPVIAHLANLPIEICNSTGLGGGHVVGWYPILASKILESIIQHAQTGYSMKCGDQIQHWIFPLVFLKTADYEEQDALTILKQVDTAPTKAEREEIVKEFGMQPLFNVFFKLPNSDPYSAVSFDNLHLKYGGLWADHIFVQSSTPSTRFKSFPQWSNVYHFSDGVFKLSFNDGSKHCTISKIFLFAAYNTLHEDNDKAGYQLLKVIHAYLNVDIQTISAGCSAVQEMFVAIQKYKSLDHDLEKQWNFIKLHYHTHLFDDIEQKGILKGMRLIQGQIDILDDYENPTSNQEPADTEEHVHFKDPTKNHHFSLGSKIQMLSLNDLIHSETHIPLPDGRYLEFSTSDMITPYQYLKVQYHSLDTWRVATDQLCCNPSFNGAPHYNFIIFDSVDGPVLAQLCFLFTCTVGSKIYPIAFVQPYKPVSLTHWTKLEKDLGLLHLQKEQKTEFISVHSIVHSAMAIPVLDSSREVFIWEVLDGDMFLHIVKHFPGFTLGLST